jgi:uncharacterized protein (TIGR02147 family)
MTPQAFVRIYFNRKKKNNPAYSHRAFARDLSWSPSFLSQIMCGKKSIPPARVRKLSRVLDMDLEARDQFEKLLVSQTLKKKGLETSPLRQKRNSNSFLSYAPVQKRLSHILRQWYHIAILDLTTCENFKSDPDWISEKLGITLGETEKALQTLVKEGLLALTENHYTKTNVKMRFPASEQVLFDVREFHKQMIVKALHALQKTDVKNFERRLISGITVATNPTQIKKAQSRLNEAMHEISEILGQGPCTELYQLNVQLFPLSSSL